MIAPCAVRPPEYTYTEGGMPRIHSARRKAALWGLFS